MVRTQKAKSIQGISKTSPNELGCCSMFAAYKSQVLMWEVPSTIEPEYFARPCPFEPRHGFVESRVVRGPGEIFKVVEETLEADPQGEVILSPVIDAKWSLVGTPNRVSIGKGNDGATSGEPVLTLPLIEGQRSLPELLRRSGLKEKDTPYFEVVFGEIENRKKIFPEIVQVRAGPEIPKGVRNYIPQAVKVQNILQPSPVEDLIDWEQKVRAAKRETPEGLVIWTPGKSLASHWAVHGIQNGLPVVTEECHWAHLMGRRLEPEVFEMPEPSGDELKDLAGRMGEVEFGWAYPDPESVLFLTLLTLHHSLLWGWGPKENALRAHAVMGAIALGLTACLGELRHWWGQGPGATDDKEPSTSAEFISRNIPRREATYDWVLTQLDWERASPLWDSVLADFQHKGWRQSYGGKKWATCARRVRGLKERVRIFRTGPTKKRWDRVLHQLNGVVNTAHNGGKLYTKWLKNSDFEAPVYTPFFCVGEAMGQVLGLESPRWEEKREPRELWKGSKLVEEGEDEMDEVEGEAEVEFPPKSSNPWIEKAKEVLGKTDWYYDNTCSCQYCKMIMEKAEELKNGTG